MTLARADRVKSIRSVMENKLRYIQISTTVTKKSDAEKIAKVLSEKKLSACAQIIGPITSVYRWKGRLEKSKEWLCVAKTSQRHYASVEEAIKKVHPYQLPEIIATPIIKGSREYFGWMRKQV